MSEKIFAEGKRSTEFIDEFDGKCRFSATYHIHSLSGQHPYFAIGGEIYSYKRRDYVAFGCLHDDVIMYFPDLEKYVKWHLTSLDGPMHYIANTLYWLGFSGWCNGKPDDPPNIEHAKNTCVYGALEDDLLFDLENASKENVIKWLNDRLPALLQAFKRDMNELFKEDVVYDL